jgi:hypothetical protein
MVVGARPAAASAPGQGIRAQQQIRLTGSATKHKNVFPPPYSAAEQPFGPEHETLCATKTALAIVPMRCETLLQWTWSDSITDRCAMKRRYTITTVEESLDLPQVFTEFARTNARIHHAEKGRPAMLAFRA